MFYSDIMNTKSMEFKFNVTITSIIMNNESVNYHHMIIA